jgi:hypothetical protein
MASLAEKSAAEKSNFKNSSDARNGNGHVLQRQRHSFALVLTTTETTRKTDRETATTATEKTTLNQVHSGPKVGSTSSGRVRTGDFSCCSHVALQTVGKHR